jgi:hypothetical protein
MFSLLCIFYRILILVVCATGVFQMNTNVSKWQEVGTIASQDTYAVDKGVPPRVQLLHSCDLFLYPLQLCAQKLHHCIRTASRIPYIYSIIALQAVVSEIEMREKRCLRKTPVTKVDGFSKLGQQ